MSKEEIFNFKVLIYKEDDLFVAACLELGLVTASKSRAEVHQDIADIIAVQLQSCFENDNLRHLYFGSELKYWEQYFSCPVRYYDNCYRDEIFKDTFPFRMCLRLEFRTL